ncbi:hypothetical protein HN51_054440 [Arachis hypogaea]|uniref:Cytochrome c oxidase subunit 5C n=3 Tax=Arachis TaxID=3817 RepID=A0A444XIF4_ARAHY|nr:uncharacterized protein LOC107619675 [Arachis ipaensis]RYQ89343.1 hypothetical protein Ahy_B09g096039 isoform A [Arachis hypogaea]
MVVRFFYFLQGTLRSGQWSYHIYHYQYHVRETSSTVRIRQTLFSVLIRIFKPCHCCHADSELTSLKEMSGPRIAHATLKGPSVVKEIIIGITLGLAAGSVWKMHHWNEQRKVRAFYDLLEKGEISVVAEEE